jgi:hemerythrin
MITWDKSMSTGVQALDEQHKMLFSKFNDFSRAVSKMINGETVSESIESATEVLDFLQFYTVWHFEKEETCMDTYKCPIASKNKHAHAEFVSTFNKFYLQWQEGNMTPDLAASTYKELETWLVSHIMRVDTQLRPCIKN